MNANKPMVGLSGEYRLVVTNPDGSVDQDTGWFDNSILDNGLITYLTQAWSNGCYVGSGSTAVSLSDTQLDVYMAGANSRSDTIPSVTPVAPNYERHAIRAFRFNPGNGTGTIREVGIGHHQTSLFSRQLVSPEVTKTAEQTLDIYYGFTVWPMLTDYTTTKVISGVTYDVIVRTAAITADINASVFGQALPDYWFPSQTYDGVIGDIFNYPTGNASGNGGVWDGTALDSGSGYGDYKWDYSLTQGNNASSFVRSMRWGALNGSKYQAQFTATDGDNIGDGIPKDDTRIMRLDFRVTYGRHT